MIGKGLHDRHDLPALEDDLARRRMEEAMVQLGKAIVEVRARDPEMVACVVLRADDAAVRLCKKLGLRIKPAGSAVFGLLGKDAGAVLGSRASARKEWLATPSRATETKVVLVAGGIAFFTIVVEGGRVDLQQH